MVRRALLPQKRGPKPEGLNEFELCFPYMGGFSFSMQYF
jgi:hypothetical protein